MHKHKHGIDKPYNIIRLNLGFESKMSGSQHGKGRLLCTANYSDLDCCTTEGVLRPCEIQAYLEATENG